MSKGESFTKISSLPISNTAQSSPSTTYTPINAHPNPYLTSNNTTIDENIQRNPLPSRDIGMDTEHIVNDNRIKANYIPEIEEHNDYVREYDNLTEEKFINHKRKKHRLNLIDDFLNEFQPTIIVFLLFFIFQLPFINSFIYNNFAYFILEDGNLNNYGFLFKSFWFAVVYYIAIVKIPILIG
jgi:hypothetical protein